MMSVKRQLATKTDLYIPVVMGTSLTGQTNHLQECNLENLGYAFCHLDLSIYKYFASHIVRQ